MITSVPTQNYGRALIFVVVVAIVSTVVTFYVNKKLKEMYENAYAKKNEQ